MFMPVHVGKLDVIKVAINIMFMDFLMENMFHGSLGPIRALRHTHGQDSIVVLSKRGDNGAKLLRLLIQLKGVVLHGDIQFGKELVRFLFADDVLHSGQGILGAFDGLVELAEVRYPMDSAIFLGNDESSCCPFGSTSRFQDALVNEAVEFSFECWKMNARDLVRLGVEGNCIRLEIQVECLMRILAKLSTEQWFIFGENLMKFMSLL